MENSVSPTSFSFLPKALVQLAKKSAAVTFSAITFFIFLILDLEEVILCIIYRFVDESFEGKGSVCYCEKTGEQEGNVGNGEESIELSETLCGRKNVFRDMEFLGFARKSENLKKSSDDGEVESNRKWSDCGCESCVCYSGGENLHVVLREYSRDLAENVIFLHGFFSSSSLWAETVFPNLSEAAQHKYRLFGVDLLGFGRSPKPRDCFYTIKDHLEKIEKSVIRRYKLKSFHVVGHSMGCIIASALAAKYSNCVKSITLIAPPYVLNCNNSMVAMEKLAPKRLWPLPMFLASYFAWYEHLGRCLCLVFCRNHRAWERILKLLTKTGELHFLVIDLTRHTHHSIWHTTHNVIFGGSKSMDDFLETLMESRVKICVMQGEHDDVVPLQCSIDIKAKVPTAEVSIISNADHGSVIVGREKFHP